MNKLLIIVSMATVLGGCSSTSSSYKKIDCTAKVTYQSYKGFSVERVVAERFDLSGNKTYLIRSTSFHGWTDQKYVEIVRCN